ncbi:uncharacterized protein TNCV_3992881 [Trichonephila clavipes]|uniref:Uncharacterized protein n=1 Tax=Trichonephila clavipes TaxID=2585209 RepID=A0A8X6VP89_TRICX|nr:uncharacterized protein TNCV_3992881 [Trichonephila clavipes]
MASLNPSPGKGLMLPNLDVDKLSLHTRFLIISLTNNEMSKVSPFVIQKALIGIGGEPKSVKRITCASVGHASTDCNLEPKCVNCLQPHPSNSKICPKWKIEKQIQEIKTTKNISYPEARKLIVPQLSQTYAQAAKSSTLNNSTQTDENITKIKCPPLKLLAPLSSKQKTHIPTAVTTSSSAQTQLLPFISSKTSTTSDPQPPAPISKTKGKIKDYTTSSPKR